MLNLDNKILKQLAVARKCSHNLTAEYRKKLKKSPQIMLKLHTFHNYFTGQAYVPVALTCKRVYLAKQQDVFFQNYLDCTASKLEFFHRNFLTFLKGILRLSDSGFFISFLFSVRFFVTFQESTSLLFLDLCPGNSLSIVSYDILSFGPRVGKLKSKNGYSSFARFFI